MAAANDFRYTHFDSMFTPYHYSFSHEQPSPSLFLSSFYQYDSNHYPHYSPPPDTQPPQYIPPSFTPQQPPLNQHHYQPQPRYNHPTTTPVHNPYIPPHFQTYQISFPPPPYQQPYYPYQTTPYNLPQPLPSSPYHQPPSTTLQSPYLVHPKDSIQPYHSPPLLLANCSIEVQVEGTTEKLVKGVREDPVCEIEREVKVLNRNEIVDGGLLMELDYQSHHVGILKRGPNGNENVEGKLRMNFDNHYECFGAAEVEGNHGKEIEKEENGNEKTAHEIEQAMIMEIREDQQSVIHRVMSTGNELLIYDEDVGSDLDMSNHSYVVESIHQSEEKSGQDKEISSHGDLKVLGSTNTQWDEAFCSLLLVAENIPVISNSDNLIKGFKDLRTLKSSLPLTVGSNEVNRPPGDSGQGIVDEISSDAVVHATEDYVDCAQDKTEVAQDIDIGHGDFVKNSDSKIEGDEVISIISTAKELPIAEHHDEELKDHQIPKSKIRLMLGVDGAIKPLVDGDNIIVDDIISAATDPILNHSTCLPGGDSEQEKLINEYSDIHYNESTEVVVAGNCTESTSENHVPLGMTSAELVPCSTDVDIGGSNSRSMSKSHPDPEKNPDVDSHEERIVKETKIYNDSEVVEFISVDAVGSESEYIVDVKVSKSTLEEPILKPGDLPNVFEQPILCFSSVEDSHNKDSEHGVYAGFISEPRLEKGDNSADISTSSRNSLEGNWGSVSVLSTQSNAQAFIDTEIAPSCDFQAPAKLDKDNFVKSASASDGHQLDQSDIFEPTSFMTLVEPGSGVDRNAASCEFLVVQNSHKLKPESLTIVSELERKKIVIFEKTIYVFDPGGGTLGH